MISVRELVFFRNLVDTRGPDDCWPWRGVLNAQGYGAYTSHDGGKRSYRAHRLAKAIDDKIPVPHWRTYCCHTCDNPACCNPKHLYFGTPRQNVADKFKRERAWQQAVTHCPAGHELPEAKATGRGQRRRCLACENIAAKTPEGREKSRLRAARWRALNPEKAAAAKKRHRAKFA